MLLLKLTLVPMLIVMATLATRRFGPTIGGLITALPLVAGPITLMLAWEQGEAFAIESARGTLLGIPAVGVYCLVYSRLAIAGSGWPLSLVGALAGCFISAAALALIDVSVVVTYFFSVIVVWVIYRLMPRPDAPVVLPPLRPGQLLLRMAAAMLLVLGVTASAGVSGPRVSGLLVVFPVATTIMAVFTHLGAGPVASVLVLRGMVAGFIGLLFFYFALAFLAIRIGFMPAFVLALCAVVAYQYGYSRLLLRPAKRA